MAKAPDLKLDELPDVVREVIEPHIVDSDAVLQEISAAIAARRTEAVSARESSGIEEVWRACEEAYAGIDNANRDDSNGKFAKPPSIDGPLTRAGSDGRRRTDQRSKAYVRLTARYVDAAAAKLSEILLPADDKSFAIQELPDPVLLEALNNKSQVVDDRNGGVPLHRDPTDEELAAAPAAAGSPVAAAAGATPAPAAASPLGPAAGAGAGAPQAMMAAMGGGAPGAPQKPPLTVADLAKENIEKQRKSAKAAEDRIHRWLLECQYRPEVRKVIFDGAKLGVGVLKGPFPKPLRGMKTRVEKVKDKQGRPVIGEDGQPVEEIVIEVKKKLIPAAKWVDCRNIYPDPACGENIRDGSFIFERDFMSERQLRRLKELDGYINRVIDQVLIEGPERDNIDDQGQLKGSEHVKKTRFSVWYYYGTLTAKELCAIEAAADPNGKAKAPKEPEKDAYVIVTMVNDRVIRAAINPLDSGELPYHAMPWQRRAGHWAGVGVAEQLFVPQQMLNGATRAMLNNAGKSAGTQIVINEALIRPYDGSMEMVPDKVWVMKSGDFVAEGGVNAAFAMHKIPNVTAELMQIVNYALKLAEESTNIPLVTQGQSGPTTPDTATGMQLQNSNANQLLRSIGYQFDDYITEPVIRDFYEWLLLDPDVPKEEKGNWKIDAHGSIALVERAIQDQSIAQMGAMVTNAAFGVDPKKWFKLLAKSKRLNPEELQYTDEEQKQIEANMAKQADPRIEAANIAAQARSQVAQLDNQTKQQIAGLEAQLAEKKLQTEATIDLHDLQMRHDLAMLDYANRHKMTVEQVKGDLAKAAMTLNTQKELNAADNALQRELQRGGDSERRGVPGNARPQRVRNVAQPLAQTPGRAANGQAFEQGTPV